MTSAPLLAAAAGAVPPAWLMLPFALLLLAIAVMPFAARRWWGKNYPLVSLALGAVVAVYYSAALHAAGRLWHTAHEYFSFLALVGSLFVISGGIHLRPRGQATPLANCLWLLAGTLLGNVLGTTGASMLLIRPFIRVNRGRMTEFHLAFFIFLVGNVGGCLTPSGPPLFLGYLKGVPFGWFAVNCWPAWALVTGLLLGIFFVLDTLNFRRVPAAVRAEAEPALKGWKVEGLHNLGFAALALAGVFVEDPPGVREGMMLAAAVGSWVTTPKRIHEENNFLFAPMREVALLFAGIFLTMLPVLDTLGARADALGINTNGRFFWFSGGLSAVLDNAPTYLAFLAAALGRAGLSIENPADVAAFAASAEGRLTLLALSLGSVFFGGITYIGNAPNFMIKSIAEHAGRKAPHFLEYVLRFGLPVMLPVLTVVWLVFFRK